MGLTKGDTRILDYSSYKHTTLTLENQMEKRMDITWKQGLYRGL